MMNVVICMGSSCFARGNSKNLEAVRAWLAEHGREAEVTLKGCRCGGACGAGPNIWIDEACHSGVTPESVPALLAKAFGEA